jgi:predicted ATP-dependent serine protease
MIYSEHFFFICKVPLSAEGPQHVEVIDQAESTEQFPALFTKFEELRSHAFNKDGLYSVIRADDIFVLIRTNNKKGAKELAFEESRSNLITNLQHRVMQGKDKNAKAILRDVHEIDTDFS